MLSSPRRADAAAVPAAGDHHGAGGGLWLSALNVLYRDINYIMPFLTQFWLFITPVAYPSSMIPEQWQLIYALNPMTGVVEGFRWALLGTVEAPGPMLAVSTTISILMLVTGLILFPAHGAHLCGCRLMCDIAIRVEDLGKLYRLGVGTGAGQPRQNYQTLRETIATTAVGPFPAAFTAPGGAPGRTWHSRMTSSSGRCADVSFDVRKGQVIGVIGRNGAGKSTLLKILSRVTEPTEGYAEVHGRVGSLLEVGTGFHPELTGRENIYLNGAILGMKRSEIDRKFDEIVEFSGVEKFIDTPVKRYSSGMYLRLAFAVAAHLEPEILVVDEVLAVGDAEFQRKCLGKMSDVAQEGRTVLFVSHNMSAILHLTEEAIVLDKGRLAHRSATAEAVDYYMSSGLAQIGERLWMPDEVPADAAPFRPLAMRLKNRQGQIVETIRSTEPVTVEVEYVLDAPITGLRVGLYLTTARGEYVLDLLRHR